jgi:RNA polymerase sigma-70 factor (ECF subfamily)
MTTPEQQRWFDEEVQPHESSLRVYLQQRFPEAGDVDDLVQESYVRLIAARRKKTIASAKAYLFAVARNVALSMFRRPRVFADHPLSDPQVLNMADEAGDVVRFVALRQETAILLDAIDALPARCREIFILIKLQGFSHQQAADQLGLSVQTIHVQVMRGLQKCTLYLKERGIAGKDPR